MISSSEAAPYYFKYINRVPDGDDVVNVLTRQAADFPAYLRTISEDRSMARYESGKWSMREVLSHVNDAERIFAMRAYWFGRTFTDPLPGWEQDQAIVHARADERSWESHVAEFEHIRASTLDLFRELPEEAWSRQGIASGYPFSVRALAYITAGHADHHMGILRERY